MDGQGWNQQADEHGTRDGRPAPPGRPPKNSTPDAREALIGATRALLRTQPPGEINRRGIAQLAGVDPGLVRCYLATRTSCCPKRRCR